MKFYECNSDRKSVRKRNFAFHSLRIESSSILWITNLTNISKFAISSEISRLKARFFEFSRGVAFPRQLELKLVKLECLPDRRRHASSSERWRANNLDPWTNSRSHVGIFGMVEKQPEKSAAPLPLPHQKESLFARRGLACCSTENRRI